MDQWLHANQDRGGTAYGYLAAINKHHTENGFDAPLSRKVASKTAMILESHKSFEKEPARRAPLGNLVVLKLRELSNADEPLGFRATEFDLFLRTLFALPRVCYWPRQAKKDGTLNCDCAG